MNNTLSNMTQTMESLSEALIQETYELYVIIFFVKKYLVYSFIT